MDWLLQERGQTGDFTNSFLKKYIKDRKNTHAVSRGVLKATAEMQIGAVP
jgi:hypothetical protein